MKEKEKINIDNEVVSLGDIEELEFIEINDEAQDEECVVVHDDETNEMETKKSKDFGDENTRKLPGEPFARCMKNSRRQKKPNCILIFA